MEPVTHILFGTCLARTGLNRRAAYTTLAMAVAAEFPDIDTLWSLRGPVSSFQHHRGITHTFLAAPFEAAIVVFACYGVHRARVSRAKRKTKSTHQQFTKQSAEVKTAAPLRWGWLCAFTLLALLSHLFLDFTNNYGVRPFFPFNSRWYAASITFIFDPVMFLLLLGAVILPPLFRLVGSEVGARKEPFAARGWAVFALCGLTFLWTLRAVQHNQAVNLAMNQGIVAPGHFIAPSVDPPYLQPLKALANPDPFNPFHWWTVTDFGAVYQVAKVDTRIGTVEPTQQTQPKPTLTSALQAAEASQLGRAYLDWSPMPFIKEIHVSGEGDDAADRGHTRIVFRDPRFMADVPGLRGRVPLQGTVELNAENHVVQQTMDGKAEAKR